MYRIQYHVRRVRGRTLTNCESLFCSCDWLTRGVQKLQTVVSRAVMVWMWAVSVREHP
jgi:hypothetical protein